MPYKELTSRLPDYALQLTLRLPDHALQRDNLKVTW